jgi:hypothetical protein
MCPAAHFGSSPGISLGAGYGLFAASSDSAVVHAGLGIEIADLTNRVG